MAGHVLTCLLTISRVPHRNPRAMKYTPFLLGLALVAFAGNATAGERKVSAAKVQVFTKLFNEANTDDNDYLDFEEFSNSYGASTRPAITEIRFDELASFINVKTARGLVSEPELGIYLEDFIAANGGRAIKPSKTQIFWQADDNESGGLDLDEFAATRVYPPSNPASTFKAFDKMDKNDDEVISPAEFGIDIKE
jgi:Ca2+-binding EF-hand superfamily protein